MYFKLKSSFFDIGQHLQRNDIQNHITLSTSFSSFAKFTRQQRPVGVVLMFFHHDGLQLRNFVGILTDEIVTFRRVGSDIIQLIMWIFTIDI